MPFAARITDITTHGGISVSPVMTVMIEGKPAAVMGAMHVCPIPPPTPHAPPSSPFIVAGAPKILIGGLPALTTNDSCICGAMKISGAGSLKVNLKV